jgi:hypothetical protein
MRSAVLRLTALCLPFVLAACAGRPAATPSAAPTVPGLFSPGVMPTAEQLCQLLTPADWTAAGLSGARAPTIDDDGPGTGSAYCTYGTNSGATGGLELDVFVGATVDDASYTYATINESIPTPTVPNLSGVDQAAMNTNMEPGFGAIVARADKLVVTVTLPTSASAADQLTSLTALVLSRASALQ